MEHESKATMGKRLMGIKELCEYCGIGECTAREWGREIGAERRIGRRVLYDRVVIDREIDQLGSGDNEDIVAQIVAGLEESGVHEE